MLNLWDRITDAAIFVGQCALLAACVYFGIWLFAAFFSYLGMH